MADNNHLVLAFSILIASLIVSGSVFFAVGSLNTNLAALASVADNTAPAQPIQQPIQQPTQQAPEPQPTGNFSMQELLKSASFTEGDSSAPIVVVEFSDFQCPFCRIAYQDAVAGIRKNYVETGKVLFAYADFPLSFHPMAQPSAEAVRCAADQGKAKELHDAIFAMQTAKGQGTVQYTEEEVKQEAQKLGLNMNELNNCVSSGKYKQAVQASFDAGAAAGVSGTPSFFVGKADGTGQLIVGAQPFATFDDAIKSALQ